MQATQSWQARSWLELMSPVVSFLIQIMSRAAINSARANSRMASHVRQLQQAFAMFQGKGRTAAKLHALSENLSKLDRWAMLCRSSGHRHNVNLAPLLG